ncbi:MAG: hypothetical protein ACBR12_10980 [Microcoleus sp.]
MKYSILVLGVLDLGSPSVAGLAAAGKFVRSGGALESYPDFHYTGTNEDGEQEEVKTGKG